jgi:hypothetical protein
MRVAVITLLAVLALSAGCAHAQSSQGSWGVFADDGCSISLYSAGFTSGACGQQTAGSSTIYYITTCSNDQTSWNETQYTTSTCTTPVANSTITADADTAAGEHEVTRDTTAAARCKRKTHTKNDING